MRLSAPLITLAAGGGLAGLLVAGSVAASSASPAEPVALQAGPADVASSPVPEPTPDADAGGPAPVAEDAGEVADGDTAPEAGGQADGVEADGAGGADAGGVDGPTPGDAYAAAPTWTYKGVVEGTELTAAVQVTGDEAVAYVCDGADYEIWLRGSAVDGDLRLTGDADSRIAGSHTRERAAGVLWVGDAEWTFSATTAPWPDWAPPIPDASTPQE